MAEKKCSKCSHQKPAEAFAISSGARRKTICRNCCNARVRELRSTDQEFRARMNETQTASYRRTPLEVRRARKKRYRAGLVAKGLTVNGTRRKEPVIRSYCGVDEARAVVALARCFRKRETPNEKHHRRWRTEPKYRLYHRLKRWMQKHLRNGKASRIWSPLLGYTVDELYAHIERQFVDGMGWYNMGEWHIDHIRPVCTFSFTSPDDQEFRECYALANLRPLWAKENLRRSRHRGWNQIVAGSLDIENNLRVT